jgi:hypothetical protein
MAIQSPYSNYPGLVERIVFNDEASIKKKFGVNNVVDVSFDNGSAEFDKTLPSKILTNDKLRYIFSVRIRLKFNVITSAKQIILSNGYTSGNFHSFELENSKVIYNGRVGIDVLIDPTSPTVGQYYDYVLTKDSSNLCVLYRDGSQVASDSTNYNAIDGISAKFIGVEGLFDGIPFDGEIDFIEIYDRALTASEVSNLYNNKWNNEPVFSGGAKQDVITNGEFTDWTFGVPDSWDFTDAGTGSYIEEVINGVRFVYDSADSAIHRLRQSGIIEANKKYRYIVDATVTTGSLKIYIGNANNQFEVGIIGRNTYTGKLTSSATNIEIWRFDSDESCDAIIHSIKIIELNPEILLDYNSLNKTLRDSKVGSEIGSDLLDGWDFTSGWGLGIGVSSTSNTFTSTQAGVRDIKKSYLTVGKKYRCHIKGNTEAAYLKFQNDAGTDYTNQFTGDFDSVFEFTVVTDGYIQLAVYQGSAQTIVTTIDLFYIYEIRPDLTPTDITFQKIGNYYSAYGNGTTSKIDCGSDFIGTKAVTIWWWINFKSEGDVAGHIISNGKLRIFVDTNVFTPIYGVSSDSVSYIYSTANSFLLNQWQFGAVTFKADGKATIYLTDSDGVLRQNGTADQDSGSRVASTLGTTTLLNDSTFARACDGLCPILKVVEGILSEEEITQIYTNTLKYIK